MGYFGREDGTAPMYVGIVIAASIRLGYWHIRRRSAWGLMGLY
jgi:hypothetical protein